MDNHGRDLWKVGFGEMLSRRALGSLASVALAALGLAIESDAKKKKKRKRKKKPSGTCIEVAQECQGGGCCPGLQCKEIFSTGPGTFCCRSQGECRFGADCCRGTYCGGGQCQPCKGAGEACVSGQCCPGFSCDSFSNTCEAID